MAVPNQKTEGCRTFKLVMIGDREAGKTTFLKHQLTGEFKENYEPTTGVDVYPLEFNTNIGKIRFNCWDTSGGGVESRDYTNAHCAIIMLDIGNRPAYKSSLTWYEDLNRVCKDIPICVCGNKADLLHTMVTINDLALLRKKAMPYFEVSAKTNLYCVLPFIYLTKALLGENVRIINSPAPGSSSSILQGCTGFRMKQK